MTPERATTTQCDVQPVRIEIIGVRAGIQLIFLLVAATAFVRALWWGRKP